jgi:Zn finger protein HypA/HybF involved in hydrogenase expression
MMQVRCQKCGWNFTLGQETIANIMNEIQEARPTHYMLDCPKCRHAIKVQTKRIRRFHRPVTAEE